MHACTGRQPGVDGQQETRAHLQDRDGGWRRLVGDAGCEAVAAGAELPARGVGDLAGGVQHTRGELVEEDDAEAGLHERAQLRHRHAVPRADAAEVVTGAAVRTPARAIP